MNSIFSRSSTGSNFSVGVALLVHGGANDQSGHVDETVICNLCVKKCQSVLLKCVGHLIGDRTNFVRLVLPAVRLPSRTNVSSHGHVKAQAPKRARLLDSSPSSFIHLLLGHKETLSQLIADYIGVPRGCQLRNVRKAALMLLRFERVGKKIET